MEEKIPCITRINCKIKNEDEASKHGLFIGAWLNSKFKGDSKKIRAGLKNSWFLGLLRTDLRKFLKNSDQSVEAIENYFEVSIGVYKGFRIRQKHFYHGPITRYPKTFINSIWFDYIVDSKRNSAKGVEFQLLCDFDCKKLLSIHEQSRNKRSDSTQSDLKITNAENLIYLLTGEVKELSAMKMSNLSNLETRFKINIVLLEPDPLAQKNKKIVRKKPCLPHKTTVHLLVRNGVSQELSTPIENFTLLAVKSGIPETFVCDLNPRCKYKTDQKSHFLRHKSKCEKLSQKQITCKQKPYGDDSSIFKQMVS